eukprot:CAMPEP_0203753184 /NCGR_PEP_ID=MMETSP0098-20131031/6990_1 /ASSEMBLY_ACC=CAM_ASM_000208 /TAXON_ID=96639 /ORGANISM=" , Strain NY0313808BC1" /LENGTH=367 /DNA_ID=CAMNT_0050643667 /DNA_START=251 /DNA_END=1354 /DNA_ORIENTATION=-
MTAILDSAIFNAEVQSSPKHGRGLFAPNDIKAGQVIVEETPLGFVAFDGVACSTLLTGGKVCARCGVQRFADRATQKHYWKEQQGKEECALFMALKSRYGYVDRDFYLVVLGAKLLIKAKSDEGLRGTLKDLYRPEAWSDSKDRVPILLDVLSTTGYGKDIEEKECADILAILECNSLCVHTVSMSVLGLALCNKISFANHANPPNSAVIFQTGSMGVKTRVVAGRDIKKGEEITISYGTDPHVLRNTFGIAKPNSEDFQTKFDRKIQLQTDLRSLQNAGRYTEAFQLCKRMTEFYQCPTFLAFHLKELAMMEFFHHMMNNSKPRTKSIYYRNMLKQLTLLFGKGFCRLGSEEGSMLQSEIKEFSLA